MDTMNAQQRLDHMKQAIRDGGVALYKGRTIGRIDDLPTMSDLASTVEENALALSDIERRKKALADEEARVRASMSGQPLGSGDNVTTTGPGAAGDGEVGKAGGKKAGGAKDAANEAAAQPLQAKQ